MRLMRAIPRNVAAGRRMKTIAVGGTQRAAEKQQATVGRLDLAGSPQEITRPRNRVAIAEQGLLAEASL
jgi:hypothetical protein